MWAAWLALGTMAAAIVLVIALRQPRVAARARWLFLQSPTLRGRLVVALAFVALIPLLTLPPLVAVNSGSHLQRDKVIALDSLAQTVANSIPSMVSKRVDIIKGLADDISAIGDFSDAALVGWLLRHQKNNPEFVSMWIARPGGEVPVATAVRGGVAERWGGPMAGVGVMDYFQAAVAQGGEYVSAVRKGVSAGFQPMQFISAPIGVEGEAPWGYLQGQLNLGKVFGRLTRQDARAGNEVFLTDRQNRVMLSSPRLQFRQFENISGHPLFVAMTRNSGQNSFSFDGSVLVTNEQGRYLVSKRELPNGWHVFAVASQDSVDSAVVMPFVIGVLWLLLTLFMANSIAGVLAESLANPLKSLDESLDIFDAERTMSIFASTMSDEAPAEVRDVYRKIRASMRKSRDAYDNMMRAVSEGEELKQRLQEVTPREAAPAEKAGIGVMVVAEGENADPKQDSGIIEFDMTEVDILKPPPDSFLGRVDSVTQLPGVEAFQEFFHEAWNLGIADGKNLSLILVGIDSTDPETLKSVAGALGGLGGRSLDFIGRTGEKEFVVLLPDTELQGAVVVAARTKSSVQGALLKRDAERIPSLNLAVCAIQPNADGNAVSFVEVGRRVLRTAQQQGGSNLAYINELGKILLAKVEEEQVSGAA